jgi:hypothetical protein
MRVVDPTLPRYGTDLMTLQNELLHTLCRWWDSRTWFALACRLDLKHGFPEFTPKGRAYAQT